jgi:hypothetical protein
MLIGVSKLCCPVCWDVLELLRGDNELFIARGRHPILSSVELPAWLPRHVLPAMILKYRTYCQKQILDIMPSTPSPWDSSGHNRVTSTGSISAYSITSDKSGSHVETI